ncbi:MAG: helix-turn-helix domain-containing protein [Candidatus Aminicenantes bacterium]|nr:helix-turn-helix domain-containing protein [Candidatus Aminicenantes bacterium]MCK5004102.1 helix-turn-helix domain-containing protein [Candidatus Aminicenantes bacterium]
MGNFGKYLRERRNAKGITSEYIALHSSLNENILNALENENHEFFNSSFYFSNFLNTYLEFLEIDRERFYVEFSEELEPIKNNENKQVIKSMIGLRYSKFRNRRLIIKGILLGVLMAVLFYLLFINKVI